MSQQTLPNDNIQVFARCRPLLKSEWSLPVPVEVYPEVNKILVRDTGIDKCTVKSFSFDKVFGPEANQADIYAEIVAPIVKEVILGFNCTIFAYGQTGTGKTFTIEGGRSSNLKDRSEDPLSGIIPRSMSHLFSDLKGQNVKFEICVSFLELYNEEIFDLLSKTDDPVKLKMYDNSSQKGSVIVQGLEVVLVKSMDDVYAILDKGCKKRRKAATLLNKASSRSHSIFTVTLNVKERSSTLEKVKTGKLNLVDLAGSENIGRSGAIDKRAREAGNINQSLLALGRVITSLCEKAGHIPYRESKLTRLLQDSLGGQTKTAVIATISPSAVHIDETLNTLEYALRIKSIMNKPVLNSQVTANSLMQEHLEEINRIRKEIYEIAKTEGIRVPEESIRRWESALESKRAEKFKLLSQIENLVEEKKLLDAAIAEEENKLADKQRRLEDAKIRRDELRVEFEKEKEEHKLYETMLQVMQPMYDSLHDDLHKHRDEIHLLESELAKKKEALRSLANEQRNTREKLMEIREERKLWSEKFRNSSETLMNSMRNMNDNMTLMTSGCNNCISQLKNEFEERVTSCDKEFGNFFKAVSDLEAINKSFQENVDISLREEKSTKVKAIEEFYDAYAASNENAVFDPLNKAVNDCESSLLCIASILNNWKEDLASEMNVRQKLMKEDMDNQRSTLESIADCVKHSLNEEKENLEAYSNIISESLNSEAAHKKVLNDKFLAVEQALSSLDIYCTESIVNEVNKTTQARSSLKNCSKVGSEIVEKLTTYCESSVKSIDGIQKEIDFHGENVASEKLEGMKAKVNSSCSRYKDLNSELAKFPNTSQNFSGHCSDIEDILKNKFKTNEQSEVSTCIQTMLDSMLKCGDSYKTCLAENQIHVEASLSKAKVLLEKIMESSKQLSGNLNSKVSDYIQCFETELLKSLTEDNTEIIDKNRNAENTTFDMDDTIITADYPEDAAARGYECPACANKTTDETLQADDNVSISMPSCKESLKSALKLPQAISEATGSKSFTSVFPRSPVRRPRSTNTMLPHKILQFPNIEKLTQELLRMSSDEEEP